MYDFTIVKPARLADAVKELSDSTESQPLGGGQTLIPTLKQRLASPDKLVLLTKIDALRGVAAKGGAVHIGGATTHAEVAREAAKSFPALAALAGGIGDPAVRNRGTIGGSMANNDPAACYPAAALATGATIKTSKREIAADDFFRGLFETALDEGEIVTEVSFPIPEAASYAKFSQPASRFALTGVFVARYKDSVRVGVTGASEDGVFRWSEAEDALRSNFSAKALEKLSISPDGMIGDLHGTPQYRAHLVGVMAQRAVEAAS